MEELTMTFMIMFAMALAIILPLMAIAHRHSTGKTVKTPLIAHCFSFFGLVALATVFGFAVSGNAFAADEAAAAASTVGDGLKYVGAALAVGLSGVGGGIAVSSAAAAALGAMSENDTIFGKALIFVGLAEGVALYGLLVALLMLFM
jgi:V/A-type H+-transporting ATPase subunit K